MKDKINILLVDDRPEGLLAMSAVLRDPNYNLVEANSGFEALELAPKFEFAVILLDVQMPGMDGFETARRLQQQETTKNTPVIFVTAISQESRYVQEGYEAGAVDYIFKPFDPHILRSKVASFATLFQKHREIQRQSERLKESEERFRLLVRNATDHVIVMLGLDGTLLNWNEGVERIQGYKPDEMMGKNFSCFYRERDVMAGKPSEAIETALVKGQYSDQLWLKRKDGTEYFAEVTISPALDESLRLCGFSMLVKDVTARKLAEQALHKAYDEMEMRIEERTRELSQSNQNLEKEVAERKRTEKRLRESELRFRTLADSAPVLIWQTDENKNYTYFNDTWLQFTGRDFASEIKSAWQENIHSEDAARYRKNFERCFEKKTAFTLEFRLRRADGQYRWMMDIGVPIYGADGAFGGFIGTCTDITEHRQAMEVLRKNDELQKEFVANVSHDFRTPVTAIKGFADTLIRGAYSDPKLCLEFIKIIERHAQRLEYLVEDLLTISVLESKKYPSHPVSIELAPYLTEQVHGFLSLAKRKRVSLKVNVPERLNVFIDPGHLNKIVQNLLSNAVKFNRTGGFVEVSAETKGGEAVIHISDGGIGISQKDMPHIFERFYRSNKTKEREFSDTGLGLHIVKQIIESNSGQIKVKSEDGKGSTFSFTVPLVKKTEEASPVAAASADRPSPELAPSK